MQVRFGSRKNIHFSDKTHPSGGVWSVVIGAAAWLVLILLCVISSSTDGNSGIYAGILGIMAEIASIVGFVLAAKCYRKDDIYMVTPALGTVLNGLLMLVCLLLYVMGAV